MNKTSSYSGGSSSSGSSLKGSSGSSSSGSSSAIPNSVGLPPTALEQAKRPYDPYEDMSFKEKTGAVVNKFTSKDFWGDVKTDFGYTPFTGVKTLLSPFQIYSRSKVGDIQGLPMGGTYTGQYNPKTGQYEIPDQYKGKTGWERLQEDVIIQEGVKAKAEKETVAELTPKYQDIINTKAGGYQSQINAGNLTVDQAQKNLEKDIAGLQKQYSTEAQTTYTNKLTSDPMYKDWRSSFNRYNQFTYDVPQMTLTGGLIGASLAGGIPAIVASGAVGVEGGFTTVRGVQEKDYVKAGIGVAMLGLGTYGAVRGTANYMTQQNVKNVLSVKPKEVYSVRVTKGDYSYDLFRSVQKTNNAYAYTEGGVVSKLGQGNQFQIVGGQSNTRVYTKDVWTGRSLLVGGSQRIGSTSGSFYPTLAKAGFTPSTFKLSTTTRYDYSLLADKAGNFKGVANLYPGTSGKTATDLYRGWAKQGGTIKLSEGVYYQGDDAILSVSEKINKIPSINYVKGTGFKAYDVGQFQKDVLNIKTAENIGYTRLVDPSKFTRNIYFDPSPSNLGYPPSGFASGGSSSGGSAVVNALSSQTPVLAPSFAKSATAFASSSVQTSGGAGALATLVKTGSQAVNLPKSEVRTATLVAPQLQQLPKINTKTVVQTVPLVRSYSGNIPALATMPAQIQLPKMDQIQIQKPGLVNPLTFATPGVGTPNFGYDFSLPPFLLDLPSGLDPGGLKKRRVKIKKVVKYTPSYSAVIFNIRGSAPKGTETGLRVRPIPKGTDNLLNFFSGKTPEFYNPFQMPKVRRRRIIKKRKVKKR